MMVVDIGSGFGLASTFQSRMWVTECRWGFRSGFRNFSLSIESWLWRRMAS